MTLVPNRKLIKKTLEELIHEGYIRVDECEDYHISDDLAKEVYNEIRSALINIRPKHFKYEEKEDFKTSLGCIDLVAESIRCDNTTFVSCSSKKFSIAYTYSELPSSLEFQINGSNSVYFDSQDIRDMILFRIQSSTPQTFIQ